MAKVKIGDVAREAGVSLGTVSNALNHPEKVRPETRRLIRETIERLGYTPNQSARMLAGGHARMLGLLLPRLDHGFCLQIISGAQNEAHRHGYGVVIASYGDDAALETRYLDYFKGTQLAGILVHSSTGRAGAPSPDAPPMVFLDAAGEEPGIYVAADCEAQGRLVAEHALRCGSAHLCVIGHAANDPVARRLRGIREAMGSAFDTQLEVLDAGEWDQSGDGFTLGAEIARRSDATRPDFVIGLSDVLASGALAGILSEGLRVPEDVRVAGCDGNPLAWCGPISLTTCAPAGYEIGRKGVQLLIERLREARDEQGRISVGTARALHEIREERRVDVVRPFLLERESTVGAVTHVDTGAHRSRVPETNLGAYL